MKTIYIISIIAVSILSVSIISISAEESLIPSWIKNIAEFWVDGAVTDQEFLSAIEWMLENDVISVSSSDDEWKAEADKLYKENQELKDKIADLEYQISHVGSQSSDYVVESYAPSEPEIDYLQYCYGSASCFVGTVTSIIDGDTIQVDGKSIRFALVDTPEKGRDGFKEARDFIEEICPVGSIVVVDEDDQQTAGSYGRMVAVVYCHETMSLNEAVLLYDYGWILQQYCKNSEFGSHAWAIAYGCGGTSYTPPSSSAPKYTPPPTQPTQSCDPSYPTMCIPPYPPDLDCGEISYRNFLVTGSDPHGFDRDGDGIGCES